MKILYLLKCFVCVIYFLSESVCFYHCLLSIQRTIGNSTRQLRRLFANVISEWRHKFLYCLNFFLCKKTNVVNLRFIFYMHGWYNEICGIRANSQKVFTELLFKIVFNADCVTYSWSHEKIEKLQIASLK